MLERLRAGDTMCRVITWANRDVGRGEIALYGQWHAVERHIRLARRGTFHAHAVSLSHSLSLFLSTMNHKLTIVIPLTEKRTFLSSN